MKEAKVVLDLENDKSSIFGNEVELYCKSTGQSCITISSPEMQVGETFQVLFTIKDKNKREEKNFKKKCTNSLLIQPAGG